MVKVTVSEKRNPVPQKLKVNEQMEVTTWGAIKVNKSHFFPSSFQIISGEEIIYIDPVETGNSEKADYIFITHAHPDHFSLKTLKEISKPETVFIVSKGVSRKLSKLKNTVKEVEPGDVIDIGDIQCLSVAAYNTKSVFLWIKAHPKSKKNVGYILTFKNNTRIYHAGDTDYIPEMSDLKDITIAMIPIGGDNLTMNMEEAAKMVNKIKPDIVIPMHYELKNENYASRFQSMIEKGIKSVPMQ
ncbi:MBL fold metallo-hydrolase [Ascidiimonas aurantiaca]|uniref:MBL fold metallo-hydrolase n=1 Tax=Ascidiimonas aurantiaca TaxID=1685432 RepID=UPI0030ED7AC6